MDENVIVPIVSMISFFGFMAYLVKAILDSKTIKEKARISEKTLEKISSNKEFSEFLKSKQGEDFFHNLTYVSVGPKQKLLASLYWGIVIFFAGIGTYIIKGVVTNDSQTVEAIGIVILFIGIGMLLGAITSFFFAKQWGLLNGDSKSK